MHTKELGTYMSETGLDADLGKIRVLHSPCFKYRDHPGLTGEVQVRVLAVIQMQVIYGSR